MLKYFFGKSTYRCFVILPQTRGEKLWCRNRWISDLRPSLEAILLRLGLSCSVHCRQLEKGTGKDVSFRGLEWSKRSDAKWLFSSKSNPNRIFVDLEIFSPPRPVLENKNDLPCFYFQLQPMAWEGVPSRATYDSALFFAFQKSNSLENLLDIQNILNDLAIKLSGSIYISNIRIIGINAFESILREKFLYKGMLNDALPKVALLKASWILLNNHSTGQP